VEQAFGLRFDFFTASEGAVLVAAGSLGETDVSLNNMSKYQQTIDEALEVLQSLKELEPVVEVAAGWCVETLGTGHKLLLCGNGGSAAEAQHLAGELVGRYTVNRRALPAIALSADASVLTCIANDFEFEQVFSRQIAALGSPGDLLVAFSTSGNSPNVVAALEAAKSLGMRSIALLGSDGGRARELAGCAVVVRHPKTARAQEGHQFLVHCLMDRIEAAIAPESAA
jgi:D-sedoheptulose 7-phosphate isomerase